MLTEINLSDVWICYRVIRRKVQESVMFEKDRFGCEAEVTAKIARRGWAIHEVRISHSGRTYAEGKKTTWKDGVRAMWSIVRYNLFDRSDPGRR